MYWKSQPWPFHVRLKVVQSIMILMILYHLPLLPWSTKTIEKLATSMGFHIMEEERKIMPY